MTTPAEHDPPPKPEPSLWLRLRKLDFVLMSGRELLWISLGASAVIAALLWLVLAIWSPPPPKKVRILTGPESGAYYLYGQRYAKAFAEHGVQLEVLPSHGSIENLRRIADPGEQVSLALVQGGLIEDASQYRQLESLASVAYEPIWVFLPAGDRAARGKLVAPLTVLAGKRIAIGPDGSGVRVLAERMLALNSIDASNTTLSDLGGAAAVDALIAGQLDAVVLVAAIDAPAVLKALTANLRVLEPDTVDAYVRLLPWLNKISLPRGVIDLQRVLPGEDITLMATTANLIARTDTARAIAYLQLDVASEIHSKPTRVSALREFPSQKSLELEQSDESVRYFKNGRPFLQRYLPFWLANLIERLLITVVPALAIAVPGVQLLIRFIGWRHKAAITQLYERLYLLERDGIFDATRMRDASARSRARAHLDAVEYELAKLRHEPERHVDTYNLKAHLDMLRYRIGSAPA